MSAVLIIREQRDKVTELWSAEPPKLAWVNEQETYYRMDEIDAEHDPEDFGKQRAAYYLPRVPAPELRIDEPHFDLNVFFTGFWIVSARMREALALTDDEAVFRTATVTGASQPARLGYAAMAPIHHVDGIDPTQSDICEINERDSPHYYWELDIYDKKRPRVALRSGLSTPAPIFDMDRTNWLMITAEAAERVRAAGITDVFFDEPGPRYGSWMLGPP